MNETRKAYFQLHIAVFLFGFTAILGDLIKVSAVSVVWWRTLIAWISFIFIINVTKLFKTVSRKHFALFLGIGVLVAIHWITFFGAVKLSNASVALICFSTTTFFTSLLEPLITKKKFQWFETLLGLTVLPGMLLIVNGLDTSYRIGIAVGLFSALVASIFSVLNKKYIQVATPVQITSIELFGVWAFITIIAPFISWYNPEIIWKPDLSDLLYLIVLALLCTTLAYFLSMNALKFISAFASNLAINLEPVYGIILAILILNEHKDLNPSFYLGVGIICISVFSYPFIKKRFQKNEY